MRGIHEILQAFAKVKRFTEYFEVGKVGEIENNFNERSRISKRDGEKMIS